MQTRIYNLSNIFYSILSFGAFQEGFQTCVGLIHTERFIVFLKYVQEIMQLSLTVLLDYFAELGEKNSVGCDFCALSTEIKKQCIQNSCQHCQ